MEEDEAGRKRGGRILEEEEMAHGILQNQFRRQLLKTYHTVNVDWKGKGDGLVMSWGLGREGGNKGDAESGHGKVTVS